MAKIQHGEKGFWITFDNGYKLSVQYGKGNYCERQDLAVTREQRATVYEPKEPREIVSANFEMAVMVPGSHNLIDLSEYDQVQGWISFEDLPAIMDFVKRGAIEGLKVFLSRIR